MSFKYYLPDGDGRKEYYTEFNSVIIIGANGSGKSKLGAWIEQQDMENIHRIGAQRNLNFKENIPLKSYSQAEELVLYGSNDKQLQKKKTVRWGNEKLNTTKLMNDFDDVLAAIIALKNNEYDKFVKECKENLNGKRPEPPVTQIDILFQIWNNIFPQRTLIVNDDKFLALLREGSEISYNSNQMSDGERAVLYLGAQVLCIPKGKTLIIDEPEVHLHRSIMNRLWRELEKFRSDCLFIYITHDTHFAAVHGQSDKIWIKEFDGNHWDLEKIDKEELPEDLLLDILGNRKNVLFVEGEKNSYDTQLYTILYPGYYVIACGSCTQVISRTKAFHNSSILHHCKVYGLIDRDYRSKHEIDQYKKDLIYTLHVAEVENLFLVEELIRELAQHMEMDSDEIFKKIKNYIIHERFEKQIEKQICQSVVIELKHQLSSIDLSKKSDAEIKASFDDALKKIDYEEIKSIQEEIFRKPLDEDDYAGVLRVFNEKGLTRTVGQYFDFNNNAYCKIILNLLNHEQMHDKIINAIKKYLPSEIPNT